MLILVAAVPVTAGLAWRNWTAPAAKPPESGSQSAPASPNSDSASAGASPFAAWGATALTVHGNAGVAPDGTSTATKVLEGGTIEARGRGLMAGVDVDLAKHVTATLHARQGQGRRLLLFLDHGGVSILSCDVDLKTGRAAVQADATARSSSCTAVAANGGWWRVEMKGNFRPPATKGLVALGITLTPQPFRRTYKGDGEGHIFIWNASVSQP